MQTASDDEVRAISENHHLQSVGIYRTVATHLTLAFVEPNAFRMDYRWHGTISTVTETRFVERRSGWSGKGIEGPPKIRAKIGERRLQARRHGSLYRSGNYEKYLIDLGEDVPPDSRVTIDTESRYVDEAATFKTFLSAAGRPSFEELSLTVETRLPISACDYFQLDDGGKTTATERIDCVVRDGLQIYTKSLSPAPSGRHELKWAW